ncbi:MAG: SDR family NAD(P)-dependent oxidoreductase [Bacteroidota bacterium]
MTLFDLSDKVVLISGSSGGIGYALAKGLGEAGATLVLNGRNKTKLNNTVNELNNRGYKVFGYPFDITRSKDVNEQVLAIEKEVGPIDVLVNNAGIQHRQPLEEFSEKKWKEIMDVNLNGAFIVSKSVVKGMIKRKRGKIINTCSLMSEVGRKTIAAYTASKGGLKMLTRAMTVDWAEYNIQVNGIGPGYFLTDMTQPLADDESFDGWIKSRTPAKRWGKPDELAGTIIYLASDASNFVNGQVIYVDGGILAAL